MPSILPFDFSRLPKVSAEEVRLLKGLRAGFRLISDDGGRGLQDLISRQLGTTFGFEADRLETVLIRDRLQASLPLGVYVVFSVATQNNPEQKGFLEIDPLLAHRMIDRLAGGAGEPPPLFKGLTEIEEGLLSYLTMKAFAHLFEKSGKEARFHLRMDRIYKTPEEFQTRVAPVGTERALLVRLRFSLGNRSGYGRLYLPLAFVREAGKGLQNASSEWSEWNARLETMEFLKTIVWGELGRTALAVREINALEAGDVVVFDQTSARKGTSGLLEGQLSLRVGRGEKSALSAKIVGDEKGKVRVQIVDSGEEVAA